MIPEKAMTAESSAESWNDLTSFEITDEIDPFLTSVFFYFKFKDIGILYLKQLAKIREH